MPRRDYRHDVTMLVSRQWFFAVIAQSPRRHYMMPAMLPRHQRLRYAAFDGLYYSSL